jgi:hypothetical protein
MAFCMTNLLPTDKTPIICGWTAKEIGASLEKFITESVDRMLQSINTEKKGPVYGDFSTFSCYIPASAPFSCRSGRLIRAR